MDKQQKKQLFTPWLKQFLTSILATSIGLGLTFSVNKAVDNSKKLQAQRLTAKKMDNAELATAIDLGETVDIHPLRKREVAERVANVFDHLVWKKSAPLSPRITNVHTDGNVITLTADQPLRQSDRLYEFETAGSDGRFVNAEAHTDGKNIIIRSATDRPAKLRYAWKHNPIRAGVYSAAGVPMSPQQIDLSK